MPSKKFIFEKFYPVIFSLIITGICIYKRFVIIRGETILDNASTITSIFIGFLGTLAGIILSSNSMTIRFMKRINKLSILLNYIWKSIQWSFIFLGLTIILQINLPQSTDNKSLYLTAAWIFSGSYSLLLTHRAISISTILLRSASDSEDK
jgi:hypothetical protein